MVDRHKTDGGEDNNIFGLGPRYKNGSLLGDNDNLSDLGSAHFYVDNGYTNYQRDREDINDGSFIRGLGSGALNIAIQHTTSASEIESEELKSEDDEPEQ